MNILKTKDIKVNWDNVTFPLLKGTPMNLGGEVTNGTGAIGIVIETVAKKPLFADMSIMVGGDVNLTELPFVLTDDALASMDGIRFYGEDGTPKPDRSLIVPKATKTKEGIVKMAAKVEAVEPVGDEPTAVETAINGILTALKNAGIMES